MVARHPRRPALAGARVGRGPGHRRSARAVLPVRAARPSPRCGRAAASTGGHAYYCYCTAERLQAARAEAEAAGGGWIYDRRCLSLTPEEIAEREAAREPRADPLPRAGRQDDVQRPGARAHRRSSNANDRGLRHPAIGRPADLPPLGRRATTWTWRSRTSSAATITSRTRRSRCCLPGARRADAGLRARAADPRSRQEAPEQAARRHVGDRVPSARDISPEAMVNFLALLGWSPGERPGDLHARRADRALRARGHQRRQRRLQSREARLVQRSNTSRGCPPTT